MRIDVHDTGKQIRRHHVTDVCLIVVKANIAAEERVLEAGRRVLESDRRIADLVRSAGTGYRLALCIGDIRGKRDGSRRDAVEHGGIRILDVRVGGGHVEWAAGVADSDRCDAIGRKLSRLTAKAIQCAERKARHRGADVLDGVVDPIGSGGVVDVTGMGKVD